MMEIYSGSLMCWNETTCYHILFLRDASSISTAQQPFKCCPVSMTGTQQVLRHPGLACVKTCTTPCVRTVAQQSSRMYTG